MGWDEMGLAAAASLRESVLDQISYEALLHNRAIGKSRLDEVVDILVEILSATNDTMRIAGLELPTVHVQERFSKINQFHIEYAFQSLDQTTSEIRNIKRYLTTTLFNAPCTMQAHYAAKINHTYGALPSILPETTDEPEDF